MLGMAWGTFAIGAKKYEWRSGEISEQVNPGQFLVWSDPLFRDMATAWAADGGTSPEAGVAAVMAVIEPRSEDVSPP